MVMVVLIPELAPQAGVPNRASRLGWKTLYFRLVRRLGLFGEGALLALLVEVGNDEQDRSEHDE